MQFGERYVAAVFACAALLEAAALRASDAEPSLRSASSFAVLAASRVTSNGATSVTGNVGVSRGGTVSGFPPGVLTAGDIHIDDALARQAQKDAARVWDTLSQLPCTAQPPDPILGDGRLPPGVHCFASGMQLRGALLLDAAGDTDAVWILRAPALTAEATSSVAIINGGREANVFWQIDGGATIASRTFTGNILALGDIGFARGATSSGSAISRNGAVTLDANRLSLCCEPIALSPSALPGGITGTPYSATLTASGGIAPYTMAVTEGSLPAGVTLAAGGTLSGAPTEGGVFRFVITATDAHGCPVRRDFIIIVCATPSIPELDDGRVCVPYERTLDPAYTYTATPLPPGLERVGNVIRGTPSRAGSFTFTISATDAAGCSATSTQTMVVTCEVTITPATLPHGSVGTPYEQPLAASCGNAPLTAPVLPPGLRLKDNVLQGNPSAPGIFTFPVTMDDEVSGCHGSRTYTLAVCGLSLSPASLDNATAGMPYSVAIVATGGSGSYAYSVAPLPPGLSLTDGLLSGTPTVPCAYDLTVTATDTITGCSVTRVQTLAVCPLALAPATLPNGTVNEPYAATIVPVCGKGPYRFTTAGPLPDGVGLHPVTGVLSGTPEESGVFMFAVDAIDEGTGCRGGRQYTIRICDVIAGLADSLPAATVGSPYDEPLVSNPSGLTIEIVEGSLPPGLDPDEEDGEIVGVPTDDGVYTFTVRFTDQAGCVTLVTYRLRVHAIAAAGIDALSPWATLALLASLMFIAMRRLWS